MVPSVSLLPDSPLVPPDVLDAVTDDYRRLAEEGPPASLTGYVEQRYGLDLRSEYAGRPITNPWGKASGQLSMTARQVAEDVEAGLGFVVLKTVIAQDAAGTQTMQDWAVRESRMLAEPIVGRSGETGWTISWKGRGWWQPFDDYLHLVREARRIARDAGTLIVPSCKYHLPTPGETEWNIAEYEHTTRELLNACSPPLQGGAGGGNSGTSGGSNPPRPPLMKGGSEGEIKGGSEGGPMPLEKDFSPTLAGSERAAVQQTVLEWLRTVPDLVRSAAPAGAVRLGLKLFNALFEDDFQLEMLRTIHQPGAGRPDFFIYGNRLFDPQREFDGHRGIAYGGPDLSDRNLRIMSQFQQAVERGEIAEPLPWSATGNIVTGKTALEYALRGASSFQLHTFLQLPTDQYRMKSGSKVQKALHELCFHPQAGLIVWLHHLAATLDLPTNPVRFRDVIGQGSLVANVRTRS